MDGILLLRAAKDLRMRVIHFLAAFSLLPQLSLAQESALERRGEELLRATGARGFEVSRTRLFALTSLVQMGEIKQACARLPADLGEADEREDSYIAVNLRVGYANLTWLVADDPVRFGAGRILDAVLSSR